MCGEERPLFLLNGGCKSIRRRERRWGKKGESKVLPVLTVWYQAEL